MNNEKVKELTQKHFDETAGDYNTSHDGKFVKCMYDEILERIVAINPETVLDLGCGNGNVLKKLWIYQMQNCLVWTYLPK